MVELAPVTEATFCAYHTLRRTLLFDPIGRPYRADHPDEHSPDNHRFVLLSDGQVVGAVRIDIRPDTAWLRLVTIEPSRQGQGLGRKLVALAEEFARTRGTNSIHLVAAETSVPFWKRCGYRSEANVMHRSLLQGDSED